MSRLIDADALDVERIPCHYSDQCTLDDVQTFIDSAPTVDTVKRGEPQGEWIIRHDGPYGRTRAYCSVCSKHSGIGGTVSNQKKPFCPNCGAKMK